MPRFRNLLGFILMAVGCILVLQMHGISKVIAYLPAGDDMGGILPENWDPQIIEWEKSVEFSQGIPADTNENDNHYTRKWPRKPPVVDKRNCRIEFIEKDMALCHILPWGANFGDELGPAIVKRILEYKFKCSTDSLVVLDLFKTKPFLEHPGKICLFTVGSIWPRVRSNDHVWGLGSYGLRENYCPLEHNVQNVTIYSVRGSLTAAKVVQFCKHINTPLASTLTGPYGFETVGDPGFLLPFLFPEYRYNPTNASKEYCLIPHNYDKRVWNWDNYPQDLIFNVKQPWENMIRSILDCKRVLSSSLHGIIEADAFGIPTQWMAMNPRVSPFKFRDYFGEFSEEYQETRMTRTRIRIFAKDAPYYPERDQVLKILRKEPPPIIPENERSAFANRILSSFPYHLFKTVQAKTRPEPTWPTQPPVVSKRCHVRFKDPNMSLCYSLPWGQSFEATLGPRMVQRILEYQWGCSAEDLPSTDLYQLEDPDHSDIRCLFPGGTMWAKVKSHDHVWGSGSSNSTDDFCKNNEFNVSVYSVRGPETARTADTYCNLTKPLAETVNDNLGFEKAGEPAFLTPFLFPEYQYDPSAAHKEFCFLPHYYDAARRKERWAQEEPSRVFHVSRSLEDVVSGLMDCKMVLSSSLYGLMLADAFGIPARWFRLSVRIGTFSFLDYAMTLPPIYWRTWRRNPLPTILAAQNLTTPKPPAISYESRADLADKTIRSFPFHLFTTEGYGSTRNGLIRVDS